MNEASMQRMKRLADDLVAVFRQHVTERLGPLQSRLDASASVAGQQERRLAELEEKVAALEARLVEREKAPPTLRIA